jgi:hypothetical protein
MLKLIFGPKPVIRKLYTTIRAMHLRLDGVLVDLEIPSALRVLALPPEESLISRKADCELELIWKGQGNPFL